MRKKVMLNLVSLLLAVLTGCSTSHKPATMPVLVASHVAGSVVYSDVVSRDPFVTQIFLKDLETGDVVQLTNSGNNGWPRWSRDGTEILFDVWSKENSFDIYLMSQDGKNQEPIVATTSSESMADWSPDGAKIAYISNESGSDEIYVMDLNSRTTTRLTNLLFTALPKWSSDGKRIAFVSNTGVSGRSQVFVMNADGTDVEQLTEYSLDNFDGSPVWCPDDSCIVFTRFVGGVPKLMLLDLAKREVSPLLPGIFDPSLPETRLARSPSSGYITFSVGGAFYAMDMKSMEVYPLGVEALDLSLYP